MRQGYTPRSGSAFAMWMMIAAKLRAEVAPGVGPKTDAAIVAEKVGYWRKEDVDEIVAGIKGLDATTKWSVPQITSH